MSDQELLQAITTTVQQAVQQAVPAAVQQAVQQAVKPLETRLSAVEAGQEEISKNIGTLMDTQFKKKFDLLRENQAIMFEKLDMLLSNHEWVSKLEDDLFALRTAVMELDLRVQRLEKAG